MKAPRYLAIWHGSVFRVVEFHKEEGKVELRRLDDSPVRLHAWLEDVTIYKRSYKANLERD